MSTKFLLDFQVEENERMGSGYSLLKMRPVGQELPHIEGGQFVNILVPQSASTFLRRPISVNNVDYERQLLWLLVKDAGPATSAICNSAVGDIYNILLPLGHGFTLPESSSERLLLVGGGVGVAPLLYWGRILKEKGYSPAFLLGARSGNDLLMLDEFRKYGQVYLSTEDGSVGEQGFVTENSALAGDIDRIYCCGPMPMMKAVAKVAAYRNISCEVSLENKMACGLGACLCCVEDTRSGNECVCTSGPVFDIKDLKW